MMWFVLVALIILLDQVTKFIIINNIDASNTIIVIDNFLNIKFKIINVSNSGAAWGIFQNGRYFFIPLTIIVSLVIIYFIKKSDNRLMSISLSFILGGAIGNLIDRSFRENGVVDFLDFHFGTYHFPTFNVADSFVVVGTILLSYYLLFIYKDKEGITR